MTPMQVSDVRQLLVVLKLFLPAPIFWSLFDQQSSRWTFQASHMNCQLGSYKMQPEQMQSLNAFLILALIPLFERVIYPLASRLCGPKLALDPVYRMASGMLLGAASFLLAAIVQLHINNSEEGSVSVLWQIPQYVVMTSGEILFSITGLEFAFSQAPQTMKSAVQSAWLLTDAAGNLLTVVVLEAVSKMVGQFDEFLIFSSGCLVAMVLLLFLAREFDRDIHADTEDPGALEPTNSAGRQVVELRSKPTHGQPEVKADDGPELPNDHHNEPGGSTTISPLTGDIL
uniref:Solute carrier family 15 member 1 n=1 Tax=Rhizochromulina marina TaxID=1034831 RepID=A0A7S2RAC6_9STRA|mmetsp:Transcript_13435/g.39104  ORF Transcript_13435/g.39104 Transcript_13435/m.39104 type:complete len:286 (+) Transcript_13435:1-858(+)